MSELEKLQSEFRFKVNELKEKYNAMIRTLQSECKHKDITSWKTELDKNNRPTNICVKLCKRCGRLMNRKDYRLISIDELPHQFQPTPVKRAAKRFLDEDRVSDLDEGTKLYYEELK